MRRLAQRAAGVAALSWLALAPAAAGPMDLREPPLRPLRSPPPGIDGEIRPSIRPLYGSGLTTPFDAQSWRDSHTVGFSDRPEAPTGIIASFGRFGLALDTSGSAPGISGLAWTPNRSVSLVAGGNLGGGGGIGASLSVRLNF